MSWRINKEKMRQSKPMPPDLRPKDDYQEVLTEAAARAYNYLRTIRERDVGASQEALDKLPLLGGPRQDLEKILSRSCSCLTKSVRPQLWRPWGAFLWWCHRRRVAGNCRRSLAGRCLGSECVPVRFLACICVS